MEVIFDSTVMNLGGTCKTCWSNGYRGQQSRIRYKAKPNSCVRCRVAVNVEYYKNKKETQE